MAGDFGDMLGDFERQMQEATVRRTREATEQLLADAQVVVPYQEGDLSVSGHASTKDTGSGAEGTVGFDTPYARYQELREDLRHQDNGQAHYLGGTLRANSQKYEAHIGRVLDDLG